MQRRKEPGDTGEGERGEIAPQGWKFLFRPAPHAAAPTPWDRPPAASSLRAELR